MCLSILFLSLVQPPQNTVNNAFEALTTLPPKTMSYVTIEHDQKKWTFERDEGKDWRITNPFQGKVYQQKMKHLLEKLSKAKCSDDLGTDGSAFGLMPPLWTISINQGELLLQIGNDTPVGWKTYALCGSQTTVQMLDEKWSMVLEKSLDSYHDLRYFEFQAALVDKILLQDGTELHRQDSGWTQAFPLFVELQDERVKDWLVKIRTMECNPSALPTQRPNEQIPSLSIHQGDFAEYIYLQNEAVWSSRLEQWCVVSAEQKQLLEVTGTAFGEPIDVQ